MRNPESVAQKIIALGTKENHYISSVDYTVQTFFKGQSLNNFCLTALEFKDTTADFHCVVFRLLLNGSLYMDFCLTVLVFKDTTAGTQCCI